CAPQDAADHLAGLDDTDPEHLLDLVDVALAAGADGDDLLVLRARLLADVGRSEEARELLLPRVAAEPLSEFLAAGATRAFWNDDTSLQRVAELLAAHQPILSAWALANLAFRRRDFAETERQCRVILDLDPTAVNTWRLRADAARAMGNHIDELAHRLAVLQHSDPVDPMDRWQLLVPATIWGEWDLVREQLPFLDLHPQSSQGPISEHWGYVTITYPDGGSPDIVAQRTGPVSAIIRGVLAWDDEQQYGDEVVFAPGFLDERPADADDPDTDWRPLFAHVCTVREGRYRSQPVTGPYPGDDAWEAVRSKLGDCDLVRADHLYELFDQQRGHKVPAVWAQLLIPPTITDAQADALLTAATADLEDPLFWWELADEAGGDTRLHAERGKRYGRKYPGV
ncbi:MAG TPA: hypothetical protein PLV13_07725, partial [Ilumatobacteraceae bacterium]|nr:hypothetical protein [Ilumatobacteraceae bacterium]